MDGLGVGDVGNIVLRDRKHLAQDGLIIVVVTISAEEKRLVSRPDVISRGFVYVRESETLIDGVRDIVQDNVEICLSKRKNDWATMKNQIKTGVAHYIYDKTKRNPMILSIIEEV